MTGAVRKVTQTIFGKPPSLPPPEPIKEMPSMDSDAVEKARRRALATQKKRSGRASTVLTKNESLG